MLLNQNELSKKLNLSKSRISQLKKEGRLNYAMAKDPISNQLKFDYKKVLEALSKSDSDYNSKSLETKLSLNPEPKKSLVHEPVLNSETEETEVRTLDPIDELETYDQARTRKMRYSAELEKLELEELSGRLIDGNKVKKDFYEIGKRIKENLLNIPDRLSAQLVAMNNYNEIYILLREEIENSLKDLSTNGI